MAIARSRLGFFEATKGAMTGFVGAGVSNVAASYMGWPKHAMLEVSAIIAAGRFISGVLASDRHGNDRVSAWVGLKMIENTMNDFSSTFATVMTNPNQHNVQDLNQLLNGRSIRDQIFTYETLFSLAKNVASGVIGYGVLSCVFGAGILTLPLRQVLVDAVIGVGSAALGSAIVQEVMHSSPRMGR